MNNSLKIKLEQLLDRYEELGALLSDSEVIADQGRFRSFSKEYADIEPVVACYRRFETPEPGTEWRQADAGRQRPGHPGDGAA